MKEKANLLLFSLSFFVIGCSNAKNDSRFPLREYRKDLPAIFLQTYGNKLPSKDDPEYEDYAAGSITFKNEENEVLLNDAKTKIRIRGTSSRYFDKKGYKIKLDKAYSLLGIAKAKKFNLLASYPSPDKLRDYLALTISSSFASGNRFTPKIEPVSLYLDNVYQGFYYLVEDIEAKKGRIELEKYGEKDEEIPFIVEMDSYAFKDKKEGVDYFKLGETNVFDYDGTGKASLLYVIDEPKRKDGLTDKQFSSIENYITRCRTSLMDKDFETFSNLVDINSFIDFFVLSDVYRNTDHAGRSVYMYRKGVEGKLIFGPSWDFDYSCSRQWSLKPNEDFSLDNFNDRFKGFEWWNLFLAIPKGKELVSKRFQEFNLPILENEIYEATRYYDVHEDDIKRDAKLWYSKYVENTDQLVEKNYKWFIEYLTKRIGFYRDNVFL